MSRDWYKDHPASPDAYPDSEYLDWAQDNGLYVDAAGNVDYGALPAAPCPGGCHEFYGGQPCNCTCHDIGGAS